MLIIDNIGLPMPSKASVYDEVMDAWTKAMVMADKLISGMAQSVQDADALLGLCAWHIYPDICAIGLKSTMVEQKDRLVKKGGLLTIGLSNAQDRERTGISWSMPLAHLRHYGKAEVSQSTVASTTSRVPFPQIIYIAMGSIMSTWESQHAQLENLCNFLITFEAALKAYLQRAWDLVSHENHSTNDDNRMAKAQIDDLRQRLVVPPSSSPSSLGRYRRDWPSLLSHQAERFLKSTENEKRAIDRYVALGRRRYPSFLAESDIHPLPYFNLCDPGNYVQLLKPERRVAALREMAQVLGKRINLDSAIIRYIHARDVLGYQMVEYATIYPQVIPGTSRRSHRRWIVLPSLVEHSHLRSQQVSNCIKRSLEIMRLLAEPCGFLDSSCFSILDRGSEDTLTLDDVLSDGSSFQQIRSFRWLRKPDPYTLEYLCQHPACHGDPWSVEQRVLGWQLGHLPDAFAGNDYNLLYGSSNTAAVFQPSSAWRRFDISLPSDYIVQALASQEFDVLLFVLNLSNLAVPSLHGKDSSEYFKSLAALAHAQEIYDMLPEAEADLNVLKTPLSQCKWAREESSNTGTASLACVCWFDTGYVDLKRTDLEGVLAVSSANSLYALELLLRDPAHRAQGHRLSHLIGNVGKPGLALLLSPRDTLQMEPDLDTWQLVNHAPYDGVLEDNFATTSLHLALTGHEQRLNIRSQQGTRDKEVFYLEIVVSAYERGTWVADLDLFHLLHGNNQYISPYCPHDEPVSHTQTAFSDLTSVDNWYEYFDRPPNSGVIRAHGNWLARLALASISLADKDPLIVINSDKVCWACIEDLLRQREQTIEERLFLC